MSEEEAPELLRLAAAVADAQAVDWVQAEMSASVEDSSVIRQLKALSELVSIHRSLPWSPASHPPVTTEWKHLWGPLEIRREIGRGSFATVYLAWDPGLEREIALKLLNTGAGAEQSAAVVQEARLLARVNHPNVVQVFGIDEHDGAVGLSMEFIEGLTLKRLLAERGAFSAREAGLIGFDLCGAAASMHRAGLLHRDIKTQNVMRAVGGRIVLMDFGGVGSVGDRELSDTVKGTPLYLAPEIIGGGTPSIASDIYSIGVLLFNLATGRHPFEGASLEDIERAHRMRERRSLADLRPDLPDAFVTVVNRALEVDPAMRFRSAGAMKDALSRSMDMGATTESFAVVPPAERNLPSVAVLPFANLGPDTDIDYFCDGLAEELVTALGKVSGLRVVSRSASLRFKGHNADVQTICRELDAATVLEGTVSKIGDKLRVSARLVNGADGFVLWSEGYSHTMDDVFAVQDDIAARVVGRFRLSVTDVQQRIRGSRHTDNPRAYHLYLKGRYHWARRYHGGMTTALDCFKRAIVEDAGYALAHAGLADVYAFLGLYSVIRPHDAFALASAAAERAMQLDPDVAEVQTSLGLVALGRDWNVPAAMRHLARAVELDPSQSVPRIYHAWTHVLVGEFAPALELVRAAQVLDDRSPLVHSGAGHMFFLAGRYEEGEAECEKALEAQPNFIIALYVKGMCRAQQGRSAEAIELLERAAALSNRAPFYIGLLGNFYARAGRVEEARAILRELEANAGSGYIPPHAYAYVYAGLGDLDRAFEWQDRANADGAAPFNYFSRVIEVMHADPRHAEDLRERGWRRWDR